MSIDNSKQLPANFRVYRPAKRCIKINCLFASESVFRFGAAVRFDVYVLQLRVLVTAPSDLFLVVDLSGIKRLLIPQLLCADEIMYYFQLFFSDFV